MCLRLTIQIQHTIYVREYSWILYGIDYKSWIAGTILDNAVICSCFHRQHDLYATCYEHPCSFIPESIAFGKSKFCILDISPKKICIVVAFLIRFLIVSKKLLLLKRFFKCKIKSHKLTPPFKIRN